MGGCGADSLAGGWSWAEAAAEAAEAGAGAGVALLLSSAATVVSLWGRGSSWYDSACGCSVGGWAAAGAGGKVRSLATL